MSWYACYAVRAGHGKLDHSIHTEILWMKGFRCWCDYNGIKTAPFFRRTGYRLLKDDSSGRTGKLRSSLPPKISPEMVQRMIEHITRRYSAEFGTKAYKQTVQKAMAAYRYKCTACQKAYITEPTRQHRVKLEGCQNWSRVPEPKQGTSYWLGDSREGGVLDRYLYIWLLG